MLRRANCLPLALVVVTAQALAREPAVTVDISATRLEDAVRILGRQSGASIGFRDANLQSVRVRAVRGQMTIAQALERMLRHSRLRARQVAPGTYLIEPVAGSVRHARPLPVQAEAPPRAGPQPAPHAESQAVIVVTGSKRAIPLGAYPGGIHIVDGEGLSKADALRGTGALATRLASVTSTHLGQGRDKLFIRGIADSSFVGPTQATVGQYWGNSRITYSAPDPSLRLYDVKSVEVLEGPQGTLYGAGSLGGVVRVVPHAPDLENAGGAAWAGVQTVQHGQPGADGGALLNLPLVEGKLGLRALGFASAAGGYIDDAGQGRANVNDVQTLGGRAALRFDPGDDWLFDLSVVGQRIDGDDSQYAERSSGGLSRSSALAQPYRNDFVLADAVITKDWGPLELTSSFGYAHQYVFERFEGEELTDPLDPAKLPVEAALSAAFDQRNRISMITAETRLARRGDNGTGWLAGISIMRNRARLTREMQVIPFDTPLTGVVNKVEEATLYGEGTMEPVPGLTVTLGGRLTHSRLSGESRDVADLFAFAVDPSARRTRVETRLLPSAAVAYRPDDRFTLFARYQEGFRPGGISVRREFVQRYKGDRVSTLEGGLRYRTDAIDVEANASWTRWRNIQADLIDGFGFPTTVNVGDGRVLSMGLSTRWRPARGLELDGALYYNDSDVTQQSELASTINSAAINNIATDGVLASVTNHNRLPNIADVTGRIGISYTRPLNDDLELQARGFLRYTGKSTLGIGPILGQLQGNYVDTGLEFRLGDGRRGVTLAISNLADVRGNRFALGSPFQVREMDQITPLQPRTVRFGVDISF